MSSIATEAQVEAKMRPGLVVTEADVTEAVGKGHEWQVAPRQRRLPPTNRSHFLS